MCEQVQANKEEKEGGKIQEGRWDLWRGVTDSKHHFLALFPPPCTGEAGYWWPWGGWVLTACCE